MAYRKPQKTLALWQKAKTLIPGGSQLLSKRAEMFLPDQWPAYYENAHGVEVTDLDGNTYIDMSYMGIGACVLGYADPEVNHAVKGAIDRGSMTTLNCPEEIALAEKLLALHPWAGGVRYARTGGEAMAIAVRIARASTDKDTIAFCGYHGWHDWYLASNLASDKNLDGHLLAGLEPRGVPRGLLGTALPFTYNRIDELEALVRDHAIAAIVMEPMRHQEPADRFLEKVRAIADRVGAVLIFDEVTAGFRQCIGGVHLKLGVNPDIAVLGKGMSNGFPMAAVIGKREVMDAAQTTFISSTYWTERIGPTAALATIEKMERERVPAHLERIGRLIWQGWETLSKKHGIALTIEGPPPLVTFSFTHEKKQTLRTLLTQEMLHRGFLATSSVYVSFSHTEAHVERYLAALDEVFGMLKEAIATNTIEARLKGPIAHTGFKRLT